MRKKAKIEGAKMSPPIKHNGGDPKLMPEDIDPRIMKIARRLLDLALEYLRDDLIFIFILQTKSTFLINSHLKDKYSKSVMATWKPGLGLTAAYCRGQRLVDR